MGITNEEHRAKLLKLVKPLKASESVKKEESSSQKILEKNYSRNRYRRR